MDIKTTTGITADHGQTHPIPCYQSNLSTELDYGEIKDLITICGKEYVQCKLQIRQPRAENTIGILQRSQHSDKNLEILQEVWQKLQTGYLTNGLGRGVASCRYQFPRIFFIKAQRTLGWKSKIKQHCRRGLTAVGTERAKAHTGLYVKCCTQKHKTKTLKDENNCQGHKTWTRCWADCHGP
ncbi:hypothetical protein Y1Q_0019202 [Alligator mississippiensis]|uniref:Uncharacterized protein n=1 Tax=Alligator mississippiensis TaxID=8496 RepID=A0A151MQB7_ALLMI|nr:hypothetical protein Y1Q_0019202 [Alligator mississippiensis]